VGRVGVADPAQDQPGGDLLRPRLGGERGERHFGDLGVADPLPELLVEDSVGVADLYQCGVRGRGDRSPHRRIQACRDREPGTGTADRCDHVAAVEGRVCPHDHQPGRAAGPAGAQRVGDQTGSAARGVGRSLPQPGRDDHRR
jgi:hypothetical protein